MTVLGSKVDLLNIEIHSSARDVGKAVATYAADILRTLSKERESIGVVFATGASQLAVLEELVAMDNLPWSKITGLHLDEYVGISPDNPGSFRNYLRKHLIQKVKLRAFHEIDGSSSNPAKVCAEYSDLLRTIDPQLCLLGIGENGHLAFNDPGVADFEDPVDVKLVVLDATCREQQAAEGWFKDFDEVPRMALTLTLPAILRIPRLILSVPGRRKADIVRRALEEPVSTGCPATILRRHPDAKLYLDVESAVEWRPGFMHNESLEVSELKAS
jgi:glucosamine-6-phosphate deaminase